MRILLVTETLHAGGAETFVVRLANALAQHHQVMVVNLYPELSRPQLMAQVQPAITLVNVSVKAKGLISKIDSLLYHANIDVSILEQVFIKKITALIKKWSPDVVHSHLFKPDYYVAKATRSATHSVVHIVTNHGDYLLFEQRAPVKLLNYKKKFAYVFTAINQLVVISDEQLQWAERIKKESDGGYGIRKIWNGYAKADTIEPSRNINAQLQIQDTEFVFGMVARGIPEKGWKSVIHAFNQLPFKNVKLILVGAGDEIDALKAQHESDSRIVFIGYSARPLDYIQQFHVGMLPTYYKAESLPTTIIEYMRCEKPTITTDIGEIKSMLMTPSGQLAGILVKYSTNGANEEELRKAMETLYTNTRLRQQMGAYAKTAFQKFDMDKCVAAYLEVYKG